MTTDKVSVHGGSGGGAFALVFLACIALIGLPVMLAETLIGCRARQSSANALRQPAMRSPRLFALTFWLMRYVAPFGILVVFAAQLWK